MSVPFPGEPAPWFVGKTSSNDTFHFSSVAGRYIALLFAPSSAAPDARAAWSRIAAARALFNDVRASCFGVTLDPEDERLARVADDAPGLRWFYDSDRAIAKLYGMATDDDVGRGGWLLLDPTLRVMAGGGLEQVGSMLDYLGKLPPTNQHAGVATSPPVLVVPRVFEPQLCSDLVDYYRRTGGHASGFMQEVNGMTVLAHGASHKRRADCLIEDRDLREACRIRIVRRLAPAIANAFQFKATRMERYLVSCYGPEGHFRAHRDNTTKGTAHRRFAVTLNLNAGEYDGGGLRFPEFSGEVMHAPTGGAIVFSCSLLHEATRVTRGERFAFLPFLYDEEGARIREANREFVAETDADLGDDT
ncbi:peroxiredoxin [Caulobacter radicis]|uniref:2OG-Fe(II) oxygenase n=1 Tax=Caulobacter radicis TaxID=2172650 RepID=UPI000D56463C|nr:2OG-Fe(II) oxygenase [Caulobacter radicis]PVM89669.1 peroxiredoxin [Caulobacter radicis]